MYVCMYVSMNESIFQQGSLIVSELEACFSQKDVYKLTECDFATINWSGNTRTCWQSKRFGYGAQ